MSGKRKISYRGLLVNVHPTVYGSLKLIGLIIRLGDAFTVIQCFHNVFVPTQIKINFVNSDQAIFVWEIQKIPDFNYLFLNVYGTMLPRAWWQDKPLAG